MIDPRKWLVRSIQLPLRSPCAIPVDAFSVGISTSRFHTALDSFCVGTSTKQVHTALDSFCVGTSTKQVHTAFGSLYHLSVTDQHPQSELRFGDI
jgi:hypothetical protein